MIQLQTLMLRNHSHKAISYNNMLLGNNGVAGNTSNVSKVRM